MLNRVAMPLLVLVTAAVASGCQGTPVAQPSQPPAQAADLDAEGCAHLKAGPSETINAAKVSGSDAPVLAEAHQRYDIQLQAVDGKYVGIVRMQTGEAGDYVVYLNENVPVAIHAADGAQVMPETSAVSSPSCGEIKGRHVVPLGIGTYYLTLGPTGKTAVGMVIEAGGEHDDH